jgi:endonuclease III
MGGESMRSRRHYTQSPRFPPASHGFAANFGIATSKVTLGEESMAPKIAFWPQWTNRRQEQEFAMPRLTLPQVVEDLADLYGKQNAPKVAGPWEMILWENVAYLADDARRQQAFQALKKRVGIEPTTILSASAEALLEVTRHGIMAEQFAEKLRKCALIALDNFDGDLRPVLKLPLPKAKKELQKFPGIGEPGAEKILLFTRTFPVLALESNGLRVLLRLGFGEDKKSYSTTYRLVQKTAAEGLDKDYPWLSQAHLLLRRHGQELCKRTDPLCDNCPLAADCEYFQGGGV